MASSSVLDLHQVPAMSGQTCQYLCDLIHIHSHIHLVPSKLSLLTSRLGKRLRELGLSSWEEYVVRLEQYADEEVDTLIDLVATNHTHFFREAVHFQILKTQLLDDLLINNPSARQSLRCWSAASSSGEEAFTLAMVLSECTAHMHSGLNWEIVGTDISRRAIDKAQQAVYASDRLGLPEPSFLHRYFQKGSGPFEGWCKVKSELQKNVRFQRLNLFDDVRIMPMQQHVIFCRNVLIYFELKSQTQLVQRLHGALEPGGYLIVGHSDSLLRIQHPFKNLGNGIYQRAR